MLEDIRNHDPRPTPEEAGWTGTEAVTVIARTVVLAGIAVAIGLAASLVLDGTVPPNAVAVAGAR